MYVRVRDGSAGAAKANKRRIVSQKKTVHKPENVAPTAMIESGCLIFAVEARTKTENESGAYLVGYADSGSRGFTPTF